MSGWASWHRRACCRHAAAGCFALPRHAAHPRPFSLRPPLLARPPACPPRPTCSLATCSALCCTATALSRTSCCRASSEARSSRISRSSRSLRFSSLQAGSTHKSPTNFPRAPRRGEGQMSARLPAPTPLFNRQESTLRQCCATAWTGGAHSTHCLPLLPSRRACQPPPCAAPSGRAGSAPPPPGWTSQSPPRAASPGTRSPGRRVWQRGRSAPALALPALRVAHAIAATPSSCAGPWQPQGPPSLICAAPSPAAPKGMGRLDPHPPTPKSAPATGPRSQR